MIDVMEQRTQAQTLSNYTSAKLNKQYKMFKKYFKMTARKATGRNKMTKYGH